MTSRQIVYHRKMKFLIKIKEFKEILFGAFSDKLKKTDKVIKWKEMAAMAQSLGLVSAQRDWTYVRDTLWQNFKKTTMFKIDNARKSGTGKLTEIDDLVIDIIGKKSSALCDFGAAESLEPHSSADLISTSNNSNTTIQSTSVTSAKYVKNCSNNRKRKHRPSIDKLSKISPEDSAKNEKLQLEIEYFKLRNHRTKLEILKLEQELNLPESEFTASLWVP